MAPWQALPRRLPEHHCLPGYIGSLSILQTVVRVAQKLREHNPHLVYGEPGCATCHVPHSRAVQRRHCSG